MCALPELAHFSCALHQRPYLARIARSLSFLIDDDKTPSMPHDDAVCPTLRNTWAVRAGPRETIYYDGADVKAAICTVGGLCPAINDVSLLRCRINLL